VIRYNDKRKVNLLSTKHHGCETNRARRTRKGKKESVEVPNMVKHYSNKKIGVDVGDQGLRDRRSFADHIKCYGWNRKWGMHGIQQKRQNAEVCWEDLNDIRDGFEDICNEYTGGKRPSGMGRIKWAF